MEGKIGLIDRWIERANQKEAAMGGRSGHEVCFVGSSLGGFYATHLAHKHGARAVLINPAVQPDIGLLYVLGVNGQLLMHFAALHKIEWSDYLELMRQGLKKHGQVREGVYAATGYEGVEAHDARLKAARENR